MVAWSLPCFSSAQTTTPAICALSLHDALPIFELGLLAGLLDLQLLPALGGARLPAQVLDLLAEDRKSTRLNSSHVKSSYAVFCLKKKRDKAVAQRRIEEQPPAHRRETLPSGSC